ncbi:hypothetical protein QVD17_28759 [Tagetes erecta]|uniref:Protein FAR1-RELATED SEQUENCE n=1 Tax=Tagetes erecta TaxID=13708 RepID=A0AAD8NSF7_TARER|nr:hypothetical protein QVD17_28759 [Tagetes erecta]
MKRLVSMRPMLSWEGLLYESLLNMKRMVLYFSKYLVCTKEGQKVFHKIDTVNDGARFAKKSKDRRRRPSKRTRVMYGGFMEVGTTVVDFKNFKRDLIVFVGEFDAEMAVQFLMSKNKSSKDFSFEFFARDQRALAGLFWADEDMKHIWYDMTHLGTIMRFIRICRANLQWRLITYHHLKKIMNMTFFQALKKSICGWDRDNDFLVKEGFNNAASDLYKGIICVRVFSSPEFAKSSERGSKNRNNTDSSRMTLRHTGRSIRYDEHHIRLEMKSGRTEIYEAYCRKMIEKHGKNKKQHPVRL